MATITLTITTDDDLVPRAELAGQLPAILRDIATDGDNSPFTLDTGDRGRARRPGARRDFVATWRLSVTPAAEDATS